MAESKLTNVNGKLMHWTVGAVICVDGKYLLIDRDVEPFGFAALAGHMGEGETPEKALVRKVQEESGLQVIKHELVFEEEVSWNLCRVGVSSHYWYVYQCGVEGMVQNNAEASKLIGWYTADEIKNLTMEPVWKYWFEKLGVLWCVH